MHTRIRSLLIALLALALVSGGTGQASLSRLDCATPAHDHAMHEQAMHERGAPQNQKQHASVNCCVLCVVASTAAAAAPLAAIEPVLSSVLYPRGDALMAGRIVVVDPGIPKRS